MSRTVVILAAGAALTVAGCRAGREEPTTNPPMPETTEDPAPDTIVPEVLDGSSGPIRTSNPPPPQLPEAPLPAWEDVPSGHPEGATNPPNPLLAVTAGGPECFKEWYDPRAVPEQARAMGGYVLAEGATSEGTAVQCPQDRVDALLSP